MPQLLDRVCPTVSKKFNKIYWKQSLSSKMIVRVYNYIYIIYLDIRFLSLHILQTRQVYLGVITSLFQTIEVFPLKTQVAHNLLHQQCLSDKHVRKRLADQSNQKIISALKC